MSGVYFNLNQGVTDIQKRYKARAKEVLEIRAKDFLAQIGEAPSGYTSGTIDLGEGLAASVKLYENGSIIHKFYEKDSFPSDDQIIKGYKEMLEIYGEIGEGYIEAHHLIPLSRQKNQIIPLDPKKDFAVLCANCHRMAHRLEDPSNIDILKSLIQKK